MYLPTGIYDWLITLSGQHILSDIEATYRGFIQHIVQHDEWLDLPHEFGKLPEDRPNAVAATKWVFDMYFLAFLKPYDERLPDDHPNNFYMEREWRKLGNFHFAPAGNITPEAIVRVVVPAAFTDRLASDFPAYAGKITPI